MIIFDEVSYAEDVLRNGCSKRNVLVDFKILAKYYLHHKNKTVQEARELMLENLKDSQTFIPINYLLLKIDKALSFAKTEQLKTLEPIVIYEDEIKEINKLPEDIKDLAFVYLFLSKWTKDPKGFFAKEADVKKMLGNVSMRNKNLQIMNRILEQAKFIKFIDTRTKELIKVLYETDEKNILFKVEDFKNPLLHYKKYLGENIIKCEDCGCLVKVKGNRQKYCKDCGKAHKQEQINQCKKRKKAENSIKNGQE